MESDRRKVYVEVNVTHRPDGTARPNFIKFENLESPLFLYEVLKPTNNQESKNLESKRIFVDFRIFITL